MRRLRDVAIVVVDNPFVFIFAAMLFLSALWSFHPDLTLKWALSYLMILFVLMFPSLGISGGALEGNWRGVALP
jgi:hypothetical protein